MSLLSNFCSERRTVAGPGRKVASLKASVSDSIPGRRVRGWFNAKKSGEFDIQCAEICGIGHSFMPARIAIRSAADHLKWVETNSPAPLVAALPAPAPAVVDAVVTTEPAPAEAPMPASSTTPGGTP